MKTLNLLFTAYLIAATPSIFAEEANEETKPDKSEVNLEPSEEFWEQLRENDRINGILQGGGGGGSGGPGGGGSGGSQIPPPKTPGPAGGKCLSGHCVGWRFGF